MKGNVMVLSEHKNSELDNITWELLCQGRAVADQWGTELAVLVIGSNLDPMIKILKESGADTVLAADLPLLSPYNGEIYTSLIANAVKRYNPSLFLMGYTYLGMETGPAVAIRLGNTMVTNCTELLVEGDDLSVVRPMFGGTLLAQIKLNKMAPCILSFEKGVLPKDPLPSKKALLEEIPFDFGLQTLRTKVQKVIAAVTGDVDITKARILVSVGRGIGSPDKIQIIRDLAEALGGAVACSRPVADMGWLPVAHQVGISANTVAPEVYIACGISGASQHVTAMRDSSTIIAINKDPSAPIFRVADYGIVGDLFDVVPAMIKEAARNQ